MSSKAKRNQILDLSGIAKLRIKRGYTQQDLSLMTKISEKRIREIERGLVDPSMMEIIQITEALGLELKLSIINKHHEPEELIKRAISVAANII